MNKMLVCAMLLTGAVALASSGTPKKPLKVLKMVDNTACCTKTSTAGTAGTANYVSVTVTKCTSAKTHDIAKAAACGNASVAASNAAETLSKTTFIIQPN